MINHLHLRNFKAFEQLDLFLRPITILAGANSSGKSSILQSLLLLRQSFEERPGRRLVFNGTLTSLGNFNDAVFSSDPARKISIGIGRDWTSLPPSITQTGLSQFFSQQEVEEIIGPKKRRGKGRASVEKSVLRTSYDFQFAARSIDDQDSINYLETMSAVTTLGSRENRQAKLELHQRGIGFAGTVTVPTTAGLDISYPVEASRWYQLRPESLELSPRSRKLEDRILNLFDFDGLASDILNTVHYVGPLRSEPQRAYMMLNDTAAAGFQNKDAIQLLLREPNRKVRIPAHNGDIIEQDIISAVNTVLDSLGIEQKISIQRLHGLLGQLNFNLIHGSEKKVTFLDVGFGLSQILPIIVAGLIAAPGDSLMIEQPETHLHPRVQERLASFFVMLHRLGKQLIIETHSDHIINGLRLLIVSDMEDKLKNSIEIAFVRPPSKPLEGSRIDSLSFDEFGMIPNWPPEFMSETMKQMQQIFRLGMKKKEREHKE